MALVGRNALFGGRRAGRYTALGVTLGLVVWSLAASPALPRCCRGQRSFIALKIVGAAYLVWLGWALRAAWRDTATRSRSRPPPRPPPPEARASPGFLSNLANPKIAVFHRFLPQFATAEASFGTLLVLRLVFSLMTLAWLAGYGVFSQGGRHAAPASNPQSDGEHHWSRPGRIRLTPGHGGYARWTDTSVSGAVA